MDEQLVSEIAATLKELRSEGHYGIVIVICSLGLLLVLAIWIIWVQRETLKKAKTLSAFNQAQIDSANTRVNAVDLAIKELQEARSERNDEQEQIRLFFKDQIETMSTVNQELRSEFGRIESKQDQFELNIKEAINIGLQDVKQKLASVSAKEFIDQIPKEFRSGLELELKDSSERIITEYLEKLKSSALAINEDAWGSFISKVLSKEKDHFFHYFKMELTDKILTLIDMHFSRGSRFFNDRSARLVSYEEYVSDLGRAISYYLNR